MISHDHVYTALDVETTGLDPARDHIIEIALVALDRNGREIGVLDTLVKPANGAGPGRTDIHGVRADMLTSAPTFTQIAAHVSAFIAGTVPIAHYAKFDMGFLNTELDRAGAPLPEVRSICTIEAARAAGMSGPFGMMRVAAALGVEEQGLHNSLPDTRVCAAIFRRLLLRSRINPGELARVRHSRLPGGAFCAAALPAMPMLALQLVSRMSLPGALNQTG